MTIEERRRELFEAWDSKTFADFDHELDEAGDYTDNIVQQCWQAFNAALDAIKIELPLRRETTEVKEDSQYWEDAGFNNARAVIRASINSLNLGIKVKP